MTAEFMIILAILVVGYGALVLHYLHDCSKAKYINKDISDEKYIEKDIGRGKDDDNI